MSDIFSCNSKLFCSSYIEATSVNFRFIEGRRGDLLDKNKKGGIHWLFLLTGTISMEKEGKQMILNAGEMCLLPAGDYRIQGRNDFKLIDYTSDKFVMLYNQMFNGSNEITGRKNTESVKLKIVGVLNKYLDLLSIYLKSGISCKYLFEQKEQELFMALEACYSKVELADFLYVFTLQKDKDLKKIILENYLKARNVQELANICGYSVGKFKTVFKKVFNESVYRWMQKQKANAIRIKLSEKGVNLKVVINEFGFSSPAHFTKFCKQWLGMAPSLFIKMQQKELGF